MGQLNKNSQLNHKLRWEISFNYDEFISSIHAFLDLKKNVITNYIKFYFKEVIFKTTNDNIQKLNDNLPTIFEKE